jgi:cytochrome c oxidase subunit 2
MMSRSLLVALASATALAAAAPAGAADDARGRELFQLCAQCHGPDGGGNQLFLAPAIAGLGQWYVVSQLQYFRSGARGTEPRDVAGLRMHPMSLSLRGDADVQAVAAYVASLPAVAPKPSVDGGDAQRGAQLYTTCAACHGADAAGNEAMKAPRLSHTNDWYLLTSLERFKAGVRGSNPGAPTSVLMRGMAAQLPDEQAMKDVVAHIMTLAGR